MAEIILSNGGVATVDAGDLALVSGYTWRRRDESPTRSYAVTSFRVGAKIKNVLMHRLLTDFRYPCVDHRDGDGLNNRRSNIRASSIAENNQNARCHRNNKCGFKGVHWSKPNGKWRAAIQANGKRRMLGVFTNAEAAARAYDAAAIELHGEFARLNVSRV